MHQMLGSAKENPFSSPEIQIHLRKRQRNKAKIDENIVFMTYNADIRGCGLYMLSREEGMRVWRESRRAVRMCVPLYGKKYQ